MRQKDRPAQRFTARSARYFSLLQSDIAHNNLINLRRGSVAFAAILLFFGLFFGLWLPGDRLAFYYCLFGVGNIGFVGFAFWYSRRDGCSYPLTQAVCLLFAVFVLCFALCISVFPFPERPGIFFPMVYFIVLVLFVFPFGQIILAFTAVTALYFLLVILIKTPACYPYDLAAAAVSWVLGFPFLYFVTDLRLVDGEMRLELEHICVTDALTGLPNRRSMENTISLLYRRCQKAAMPMAVMMADVDNFKAYNDKFGHLEGDACLEALGGVFSDFSDEQGIYACRYGGEEFLFVLAGCDCGAAKAYAEELAQRVRALKLPVPGGGFLTVSIGVACEYPAAGGSCMALVGQADAALYRAKAAGKDRAVVFCSGAEPESPAPGSPS